MASTDIYDVILYPDPVLKQRAAPVESITEDIRAQAGRMMRTMHETRGIGLAANQVGIANRIFVMDVDPGCWRYANETDRVLTVESFHRNGENAQSNPLVMINPEIVRRSDRRSVYTEGCLSLPAQYADVERPATITVAYTDIDGNRREWEAAGLESHCVQHELDHLDGILFIDHISRLKRGMIVRKLEKYKKSEGLL